MVESVRARWFLALASVAFVGSIVAVIATCPDSEMKETIRVEKSTAKKIGKCRQAMSNAIRTAKQMKQEAKPRGAQYRDIILAAQPQLDACVAKTSGDVSYKVTVTVDRAGRAKNVEVRGASADLRRVSMKTVGCVENVMERLSFPAADNDTRVSVNLKK